MSTSGGHRRSTKQPPPSIGTLVVSAAIKLVVVVSVQLVLSLQLLQAFTITILCLIAPDYAAWYTIVLSYLICTLTFLYALLTVVIHGLIISNSPEEMANWAISEVVCAALAIVGWMFICALCADVSMNTNDETGWNFGWAAVSVRNTPPFTLFTLRHYAHSMSAAPWHSSSSSLRRSPPTLTC